jgi:hypothetical protein
MAMIIVTSKFFRWRRSGCSPAGERLDQTAARGIPQARRTVFFANEIGNGQYRRHKFQDLQSTTRLARFRWRIFVNVAPAMEPVK